VASRKQSLRLVSTDGRISNPGHMPLEMALHAIEHGASLGMKSLQLSGGDPLLYPYLLEVVRAGASHPGVFIFMNSVGTGVTTERAREIIEAGLGAWNFSVDTLDPAKYEKLRGVRGALTTIMEAVRTVREAAADHPDFCINYMTVVTRHNFKDIPDAVRHCVDTDVASIYLMNVYGDLTGASLLTGPEIHVFRDETIPEILKILREKDTRRSFRPTLRPLWRTSSRPTTQTRITRRVSTGLTWSRYGRRAIHRIITLWWSQMVESCRAAWWRSPTRAKLVMSRIARSRTCGQMTDIVSSVRNGYHSASAVRLLGTAHWA
jgi:radical SAM family protein